MNRWICTPYHIACFDVTPESIITLCILVAVFTALFAAYLYRRGR